MTPYTLSILMHIFELLCATEFGEESICGYELWNDNYLRLSLNRRHIGFAIIIGLNDNDITIYWNTQPKQHVITISLSNPSSFDRIIKTVTNMYYEDFMI